MIDDPQRAERLGVVIFSSLPPGTIERMVRRIDDEVPGARVAGVLYETHTPLPVARRIARFFRNLPDPRFVRYVFARAVARARSPIAWAGDVLLGILHGTTFARPRPPATRTLADLAATCAEAGAGFRKTDDFHGEEALAFTRETGADLGLVFGTRILKKRLYDIPKLGSINIHKRKLPEFRGGGPVGLWELLEGRDEIGITVHRVVRKVDAGAIVAERTLRIERNDTLESLALKAEVIGEDLILAAISQIAAGSAVDAPLAGKGRLFRVPLPHDLHALERRVARERPGGHVQRSRPRWKLLVRILLFGPGLLVRNWRRRMTASFPVVVLYHHLVSDRDHPLAVSTTHMMRQARFLERHYRVVSHDEAIRMLATGRVDQPTLVLTFDDGYADNALCLRAVTEATGLPVTHFVCTSNLSTGARFVHDVRDGIDNFPPMTWDDARLLLRRGTSFGSHTRSHHDCGTGSPELLRAEIEDSRAEAERGLGAPVTSFSFPWGKRANMSETARALATQTYDHVFSAIGGENVPCAGETPRHLFRRDHPNDIMELELAIQGALELERRTS